MKFSINSLMGFIKKPLIDCKDTLKKFQEEPVSSLYILLIVLAFGFGETWFLKWKHDDSTDIKMSELLEAWAVILILTGTIWTAFGVVMSPKAKKDFEAMSFDDYINFKIAPQPNQKAPTDPVKRVIDALIVASNFATSGLFLITLGSLLLLLKIIIPS